MPYGIDIFEDDILNLDAEVLERLLWDHSRPKYNVDGEERHHHIYWATDNYESMGDGYQFFDEIQISSITRDNRYVVRPRAAKNKEEQLRRTREKAEVFTPSWVCNTQNNMVDNAWFGRADVFNEEYIEDGIHKWRPTKGKISFPDGKEWKDYILDKRLEVSCGEAPYLVSRYDTTTGEPIKSLSMRIGLLDRKLRIVGENVDNLDDWIYWAKCSLKSTYGFEWQGDNILLARKAILFTFIEYYNDFCENVIHKKQTLNINTLRTIAYIISWNIWQMDGIKMVLPNSCKVSKVQTTIFNEPATEIEEIPCIGCTKNKVHAHTGIYAKVAEWANDDSNEPIEIIAFHSLKDMKFNAIVGNPPYQKMDGGAGASAVPIYNHFVNRAKEISSCYISMIMPSRWMTGGRGLDDFRATMISDRRISMLYDFYNANICFDNVEIKGGICYFLWDNNHDGPCVVHTISANGVEQESERYLKDGDENIFIRDSKLIQIKNKVAKFGEQSFETIVSSMKPYGIRGDFFKNPAKYGLPPVKVEKSEGDITIVGLDEKLHRTRRYVNNDYPLPNRDMLEDIKLFVPRNYGSGRMGEMPSNMEYAMPFEACTETFVQIGPFKSLEEAKNCEAYMRTKLFTVLVGMRKQDQGAGKSVYRYAPVQDFSVLWTDEMLCEKYGISVEEQNYIEQIIK